MLGLGMASSHAPMMFQKAQYWPRMLERIPAEAREQLPRSAREEIASPAIIDGEHPAHRGRPGHPARAAPGLPPGRPR